MYRDRLAIEALRAGVPNEAVIRALGTNEKAIEARFRSRLDQHRVGGPAVKTPGQVVAGGFGAGKSHLLGYLQDVALEQDFVVSFLTISKETPLFDLSRVFVSAVRNALVAGRNDDLLTILMSKLNFRAESYDRLQAWAQSEPSLSPIFPALLHLLPQPQTDPERLHQIGRFLGGGKLGTGVVRQWLREIGAEKLFRITPVKQAQLAHQRLVFLPRLIAAAGYSGWVVLLDEVELIGRYSAMQRGRSYAELYRWLTEDGTVGVPGIAAVAAITDDFTSEVINKRGDALLIAKKLEFKGDKLSNWSQLGMRLLESSQVILGAPTSAFLQETLSKARQLYEGAYNWSPQEDEVGRITAARSIRHYVKSWVTMWDIERLYGMREEVVSSNVKSDYSQNEDLEQPEAVTEEE